MLSEFELINSISNKYGVVGHGVSVGIGDDCAVLRKGAYDLVTTDTLVENVHFSMSYMTPEQIGYRTMAASLSDIAAMGGTPGAYFVNLSLGAMVEESFVERFYSGVQEAVVDAIADFAGSQPISLTLAGGDMTRTLGPCVITLTLLGRAPERGAVLRRGASVGDFVCVTGTLGDSGAGLAWLAANPDTPDLQRLQSSTDQGMQAVAWLAKRHCCPTPRLAFGAEVGRRRLASAMIDCSDGLLQDLGHIASSSGVGADIDLQLLPLSPQLSYYAESTDSDPLKLAATAGEDYELILTVSPENRAELMELASQLGVPLTVVGVVTSSGKVCGIDAEKNEVTYDSTGYRHW